MKVTGVPVAYDGELYCRYPGQSSPQPVYVELDAETGVLSASYDPIVGPGVPVRVYHGHVLRWRVPPLRADAANALLEKVAPVAAGVCEGYDCVWDGHNHVGKYTDAARDASDAIAALCERAGDDPTDVVSVWDAADWYAPLGGSEAQRRDLGITAATSDEELDAIEKRETDRATSEGVYALEDLRRHLAWLRDDARRAAEEEEDE